MKDKPTSRPTSASTMLEYRQGEYARLGNDLTAFELLREAGVFDRLSSKLSSLIRRHRQMVFDKRSGDAHSRAIHRLKSRTITGKAVRFANDHRHQQIIGDRLSAMGY